MKEFENVRYCPFCDTYHKETEVRCFICYRYTESDLIWGFKTKRGKEKWLEKNKNSDQEFFDNFAQKFSEEQLQQKKEESIDFDKRYRAYMAGDRPVYTPRCPTCHSPNIHKVSTTAKLVDAAVWGLLARKPRVQFHCDDCGYEW